MSGSDSKNIEVRDTIRTASSTVSSVCGPSWSTGDQFRGDTPRLYPDDLEVLE